MLRMESNAVPEGNGLAHQQDEFGLGQPTPVDPFRKLEEIWDGRIDVITRLLEQHLTSPEQDARQPPLPMVAGESTDTKTRERTEGAATEVQAMHGDSCSATRVDPGPKTNSTSFGMKAKPPFSIVEMTFWSRTAMRRPNRVSHPWRCTHHQPPVAYFPPAKPIRQRRLPSVGHHFGFT